MRIPHLCFLAIAMVLAGCALFQPNPQQQADDKESMLSAAGFRMLPAQTPDKLAHIESLAQLKVKYFTDKEGALRYWMADSKFCRCVYMGNESAYQKYKQMEFQAKLANEQHESSELQMEAAQQEQLDFMNPMLVGPMWMY
jgi:hypothetical protein